MAKEMTKGNTTKARKPIDVVIAGGGFAGLALAIALRQGLGGSFTVTVADPALAAAKSSDTRASGLRINEGTVSRAREKFVSISGSLWG